MKITKKAGMAALSLVTMAGVTGCIEDGSGGGAEVDAVTARQAIESNTVNLGARLSTSMQFLEASSLFEMGFGASTTAIDLDGGDDQICEAIYDEAGMYVGESCTSGGSIEGDEVSPEFDADFNDESQELAQVLNERVFADGNIEAESGTSVTYLIRGEVFCTVSNEGAPIAPDGEDNVSVEGPDPECVSEVDAAEIRLVVTSPSTGNVDIDILVGPNRLNPFDVQLHQDMLAGELDLAAAKGAITHLASISGGEAPELPATMSGRIRAELKVPSDTQVSAALSILQAVKVADGDYNLQVGVSQPAFEVKVDGAAKTLRMASNVGGLDAAFPVTSYSYTYDDTTGAETETSSTTHYAVHIPAASHTLLLDAAAELVSGSLSLADTATFSVEGNQVLGIDLNAAAGRALDFSVKESAGGGAELSVDPSFDLKVAMNFAQAIDHIDDVEDWMLDDVLHINLSGAAKPTLRIEDGETEVVEGTLSMSLQEAGTSVEVAAGQCLIAPDDTPQVIDSGSEPVEPTPSLNPIEELSAGACGA